MAGRPGSLVAALVVLGLVAAAPTAQAASRQCIGVIGPETVRGDVVVPAGAECTLAGTRVRGSVQVREGARLFTQEADIDGSVRGSTDSTIDLDGGSVNGSVESRSGDVLNLFSVAVDGQVRAGGGQTQVFGDGLEVGGTLEARGVEFFDLLNSTVNGNFYVRDTLQGSRLCANTLNGNAEFTGNLALLTIGSLDPIECAGNRVNGTVKVEHNEADTEISDNEIGGNLSCFDNDPPPRGGGNRVRGNKEGQCRLL
jgi:hypothetical protein